MALKDKLKKLLCVVGCHDREVVNETSEACGELWALTTYHYRCKRCGRSGIYTQGDAKIRWF